MRARHIYGHQLKVAGALFGVGGFSIQRLRFRLRGLGFTGALTVQSTTEGQLKVYNSGFRALGLGLRPRV